MKHVNDKKKNLFSVSKVHMGLILYSLPYI